MADRFTAPVVGVGAVVWKNDRLLLIRRGHPPLEGSWSLPGGHQMLGETVNEAAARELLEEAGIAIRIVGLAGVVDLIERGDGGIAYHYTVIDLVAEWVGGEAVAGDDAADLTWATRAELPRYNLTPKTLEIIEIAANMRQGTR